MGGRHSRHVHNTTGNHPYQTKVRSCRDVCQVTEAENDYEVLVKRLEELENSADKTDSGSVELEADFLENSRSCQTSNTLITNEHESDRSTVKITCDNNVGNFKNFLEKNMCIFNQKEGTDSERCNEKRPHLHGYLNGIPIVMKLFDTTEEEKAYKDRSMCSQPLIIPETEFTLAKETPRDIEGDKRNFESELSRQTSPMTKIQSASTSPCTFSKESLKSENYSSPGSKCSRDYECLKKCATIELPQLEKPESSNQESNLGNESTSANLENDTLSSVQEKKKRSKRSREGKRKKSDAKRRPWLTPPIPALKSAPLSNPSAVPRHIWYGNNAYALTDEEPKPRSTFNSENTARKNGIQAAAKTRIDKGPEITISNLAVSPKTSPFKPTKIERKNATEVPSKEKNEWRREYLTYSVLFDQNCAAPFRNHQKNVINLDSTCDVLRGSRICRSPLSKYAFLFTPSKESQKQPSFRSPYDIYDGIFEANYFAAPVRVPKLFKIWHKKFKNSRRRSHDTDVRFEQDVDHNGKTLSIARAPPPRSSGPLLMGAKTVIIVREDSVIRHYIENCGAEEITPPSSEDDLRLKKRGFKHRVKRQENEDDLV